MLRVLRWLPALAWMGVIFWSSSGPAPAPPGIEIPDKVAHFVVYAVLGTLLWLAAGHRGGVLAAVITMAVGGGYGALDEAHQRFVPARTAEVADWAADLAGLAVAVAMALAARRVRRRAPG